MALPEGWKLDESPELPSGWSLDPDDALLVTPGDDESVAEEMYKANGVYSPAMLEGALASKLPSRKTITKFARPLVEGGAAVAGGMIGLASPVPGGTVIGTGLGYGIGKKSMDLIEGESAPLDITGNPLVDPLIHSGLDVGTGMTMEMGGQVAAKTIGGALSKIGQARAALRHSTPAITDQGLKQKAGQIIAENTGDAPLYAQNAAETAALEIPGYKPSIGEARNDPGLIKLQRGIATQPGTAANTVLENKAANQQAIIDHLDGQFTGTETIDDVIAALNNKKLAMESATAQAGRQAETVRNGLNPVDVQTVGRGVADTIEAERIPAKTAVNRQYEELPNQLLPTSQTAAEIKALKKEFRNGDEDVYPSRAISRIEEALQGPKPKTDPQILGADGLPIRQAPDFDPTKAEVGFQDLHSLRKDIGRQIQDAITGMNPNRELAMKLQRLKSAIDSDIEAGMGSDNAYDSARTAFQDYAKRFRTGEIAKITQRGNQSTGLNIPEAQIAKRVFTPDGADDFIRAVGLEKSAAHADQYAAHDLLSKTNPLTGELDSKIAAAWVRKNATVLEKYGLKSKYDTVAKAQAAADLAKMEESEFTKTAASRLLGADVDKSLAAAFSTNPKNTAAVVKELIKNMNGDKQGIKGLQNSFKDFLVAKAETTAQTITGENIISPAAIQKELAKYEPAMRELYKNEPAKIQALQRVSKAIQIESRSAKSPLGGGSDTAEKLAMAQSTFARVVNILPGVNMATRLASMGLGSVNKLNAVEINNLVAKALYDPELAQTLALAAKKYKPAVVEKRINSQLMTLGLYSLKPSGDNGDESDN